MRKKRRRPAEPDEQTPKPPKAPRIASRPFADALAEVKPAARRKKAATKPARRAPAEAQSGSPSPAQPGGSPDGSAGAGPGHGYEDRMALKQAYAGVRPLASDSAPKRLSRASLPESPDADEAVRARLDALVSGGVHFRVTTGEDGIEGLRHGTHESHLRTLTGERPAASLDLHGLNGDEADRAVVRFIREHARAGERAVRIVHGKGSHSADGVGVLSDRAVKTLTGPAAAFVVAFVTAPPQLGGRGALLVRLAAPR